MNNTVLSQKQDNIIMKFLKDVFLGWTTGEAIYAVALILLQVAVYIWNPDSLAGFITGLTGTICVILAAKRKISNYVFGLIQTAVGLYLGLQVHLWAESAENLFYLIAQFVGIATWSKHMIAEDEFEDKDLKQVETRKFGLFEWLSSVTIIAIGTLVMGYYLSKTSDPQPYLDAATFIIAIVAQIVMLIRYREQWVFWFLLNIISIYQWFTLGNMSMVALYVAFIINNAYGYYQWTKGAEQ